MGAGWLYRGTADPGLYAGLRDSGESPRNPGGPDRLHWLSEFLPLLQLGAARTRLQQRQACRPAQLLYSEDPAGHRARQRRAGGGRAKPDVQRAQRLPVWQRPVLLERIYPDGEAVDGAVADRAVSLAGRRQIEQEQPNRAPRMHFNVGRRTTGRWPRRFIRRHVAP